MKEEIPGQAHDPDEVYPYRLLKRLGTGGMGEVFLALDQRLDRRVAIKRLRADRDFPPAIRERLHREARYAAGLNHPSIVKVHDVLERHGTLYLIMEWIQGEDLRRRLQREGPMAPKAVIRLGRALAAGLSAAHQKGIIHRDFKSENVLLDAQGEAKIVDFGIAKRLHTGDGPKEESLTESRMVLGTYRILSPEQVLGEGADQRSDLFSFGVLLFEALTGRSPFGDSNSLETLHRIVESKPARLVSPYAEGIPRPLRNLIERLLAKDPDIRPRSAREVELALADLAPFYNETGEETLPPVRSPLLRTAPEEEEAKTSPPPRADSGVVTEISPRTLPPQGTAPPESSVEGIGKKILRLFPLFLGLSLLAWILFRGQGSTLAPVIDAQEAPIHAAVMVPELRLDRAGSAVEMASGEHKSSEVFSEAVRVAMIRALISLEGVAAKGTREIDRVDGDFSTKARAIAAQEILTSSILWHGPSAHVTLERLRVDDGVVLWSAAQEIPSDDLALIMRAVTALTRRAFPDHPVRAEFPGIDAQPQDIERFLEIRRRFLDRRDGQGQETLEALAELRTSSPEFVDIDLLLVDAALRRFSASRDPADLEKAEEAVRRAENLASEDPRVLRRRVYVEIEASRPRQAESALERLQAAMPGDSAVDDLRARLWRREGRQEDAAKLLRRAAAQYPAAPRLIRLARLEIDLGQIEAARGHLRQALARSAGDFEALSLLAQLELTVGDPTAAIMLYERLVARNPGLSELSNLGLAFMLQGRYAQAVECFEKAMEIAPRNPFVTLNLADALWLSGERDSSLEHYGKVVELVGLEQGAGQAQFLTVQAQALAHLGRGRDAIGALQKALALAPESANVAYEASLVYALLGETTSALVLAETALGRGFEPRWFEFPWFESLDQSPEFDALIEASKAKARARNNG